MAKTVSPGVQALRDVVEKVYRELREAKEAGEPVGWSSSKFPCELAESFGLHVGYPENQAAGIAANRDGEVMCQAAEDLGYDNDICGYSRISLAYAAGYRGANKMDKDGNYVINPNSGKPLKDANGNKVLDENGKPVKDPKTLKPYATTDNIYEIAALPDGEEKTRRQNALHKYRQMTMPMPDFVLCCNNICNCMTKWYEDIARRHNIPLIMIDVPYNEFDHVNEANVKYIRSQLDTAIRQMEEISGKKFDEDKFEQCCQNANRTAKAWLKVCDYLQYKPSPFNGFDLFNHMADVVTARGRVEAAEAFELLASELEEHVKNGTTTAPFKEQHRIMFEGIPCWPKLPDLFKPLKANGLNITGVVYAPAFGLFITILMNSSRLIARLRTPFPSNKVLLGVRVLSVTTKSTAFWSTTTVPANLGAGTCLKCSAASRRIWAFRPPASTVTRLTRETSTLLSMKRVYRAWSKPWKQMTQRRGIDNGYQ